MNPFSIELKYNSDDERLELRSKKAEVAFFVVVIVCANFDSVIQALARRLTEFRMRRKLDTFPHRNDSNHQWDRFKSKSARIFARRMQFQCDDIFNQATSDCYDSLADLKASLCYDSLPMVKMNYKWKYIAGQVLC